MKLCKMIPPAAAPVLASDLYRGVSGLFGDGHLGKLEEELKGYFGAENVFLVSSGKAALTLILEGLSSVRDRKKVIIPGYTCYSVPSSVRKSGLEIVPCDLKPDTLDYDYLQLEKLANEKTLCVLSTHLFGIPTDIDRARRICGERGIFLVEDAAQAMGGMHDGRILGTIGDVGFFSLGRGKSITCGSGGIIITGSREIAGAIEGLYGQLKPGSLLESAATLLEISLMGLFMNPYLYWLPAGLPFLKIGETRFYDDFPMSRMNRAKSGVMYSWRRKLDCLNETRKAMGEYYKNELNLNGKVGIYSRKIPYLRFPVYLKDEQIKTIICKEYRHFGVSPMYPGSVDSIPEIKADVVHYPSPGAAKIARKLLTLPTHNLVDGSTKKKIRDAIINAIDREFQNG